MIASPLANKVVRLYSEFVHQTLFFEIVTHELPRGIAACLKFLEEASPKMEAYATPLALTFAAAYCLLPKLFGAHGAPPSPTKPAEPEGKEARERPSRKKIHPSSDQPRDRYGRFKKKRSPPKRGSPGQRRR